MLNLTGETKDVIMDGCTVNHFCILLWNTRAILQYVYLIKIIHR